MAKEQGGVRGVWVGIGQDSENWGQVKENLPNPCFLLPAATPWVLPL